MHVAVFGAAGRVGRAVTSALLLADQQVTAVLRDPARHELPGPRIVRGDAREPDRELLGTVDAVVLAVTPFSAPPDSFEGFPADYYTGIVTALDRNWARARRRLVMIGLTATLELDTGGLVMDDPELFPARLRVFALAHAAARDVLSATTLDWAILTPPAGLGMGQQEGYRLVREPVTVEQATAELSRDVLAMAVTEEVLRPVVHGARVLVT